MLSTYAHATRFVLTSCRVIFPHPQAQDNLLIVLFTGECLHPLILPGSLTKLLPLGSIFTQTVPAHSSLSRSSLPLSCPSLFAKAAAQGGSDVRVGVRFRPGGAAGVAIGPVGDEFRRGYSGARVRHVSLSMLKHRLTETTSRRSGETTPLYPFLPYQSRLRLFNNPLLPNGPSLPARPRSILKPANIRSISMSLSSPSNPPCSPSLTVNSP